MTNLHTELDEIIQHCNYMETTGEPGICHWCGERQTSDLHTLKKQIIDWHNKQVLEIMKDEQYDDERSVSMFKRIWRDKLKERDDE